LEIPANLAREWYHSAQQTQYIESEGTQHEDTFLEDIEESEGSREDDAELRPSTASTAADMPDQTEKEPSVTAVKAQHDAHRELKRNEMLALVACFVGT
jgi:hypothetical protein